MKDLSNKVVAITGAGSGIGRDLALQLARKGARLVLNDWNLSTLEETLKTIRQSGGLAEGQAFDVGDLSAFREFTQFSLDAFGKVDGIINNAGIALEQRTIEQTSFEDFERLFQVNLWGVIYGSKLFIPLLRERPEAFLVNISSVFGIMGYPLQGPYSTAKFAVRGLTETLRYELKDTSILVSCVHPGGIRTNIIRNIEPSNTRKHARFAAVFEKMAKTSSEEAAAVILKGIEKGKNRILIGSDARFIDRVARLLPSTYERILLRKFDLERFSAP